MPAAPPPKTCLLQFRNCRILRDHKIYRDDLWVRAGKIINPEKIFFDERILADIQVDCNNSILTPGFIDAQINGESTAIDKCMQCSPNNESMCDTLNVLIQGLEMLYIAVNMRSIVIVC